jgi:hypothetical protein
MNYEANEVGLSQDQAKVLRAHASTLFDAVSKYSVSPLRIEADALDLDDVQNNRVWSVVEFYATGSLMIDDVEDGSYRTDEMLVPRFVESALWYHVAAKTFSDEAPLPVNPHTSLFFICAACESQGCQECDDEGQLTFLATWSENEATYSRS